MFQIIATVLLSLSISFSFYRAFIDSLPPAPLLTAEPIACVLHTFFVLSTAFIYQPVVYVRSLSKKFNQNRFAGQSASKRCSILL